jgi:excinuclease UvrABC helicase subunit UvrB
VKSVEEVMLSTSVIDAKRNREKDKALAGELFVPEGRDDPELLKRLEGEMWKEAEAMHFEKAASIRDRIEEIKINLTGRNKGGRKRKMAR